MAKIVKSDIFLDEMVDEFLKDMELESDKHLIKERLKAKDIVVYEKDTRQILAIIPLLRNDNAVLKKGIDFEIRDSDSANIIGNGQNIFLSKE